MNEFFASYGADILAALAAAGAFVTVIWVGNNLVEHDTMSGRIRALEERRKALQAGASVTKRRRKDKLPGADNSMSIMRQVVNRMKLMHSQQADKITNKMMQAGFRSRDAVIVYFFFKMCMPIMGLIAAVFMFHIFGDEKMSSAKKMMYSIMMVIGFSYAPELIVKNLIDRRRSKLRDGLPDALDLLVICTEAGLSLDAGLSRVAREIGPAYPHLAEELGLTSIELGFLQERSQALENLAMRVDLAGVRALVGTLQQTEKYGTPLAQSLRVLSSEFRNERLMKAEEKAARLPAVMTVPMVVFILPPLFIVLIGPAALKAMEAFANR